jgi:formylglycine-generating enzyme required for sulfatase activity
MEVTLPTEAEWEYACRAGTDTPLWFGDLDADFSGAANVADSTIRDLAYEGWRPRPPDLVPRDARYDDGHLVTAPVGTYRPNPWGLHDMHGNAAEWTLSEYRVYPYEASEFRHAGDDQSRKVVRGGSWYDRPHRCRSAFRLDYDSWQKIYNVGFRVIVRDAATATSE